MLPSPFIGIFRRYPAVILAAACCIFLGGCGYIGPVQPPLLDIPQQVPYVSAIEYGDKIQVDFTLPDLTTEGNPLHNARLLDIRVGPGVTPMSVDAWVESAKSYPVPSPAPGPFTREIPVSDWQGKEVLVAVRAVGPKGHAAQWSTLKVLAVRPPLQTPAGLKAENVEQGVRLSWTGSAGKYRIYRAIADAAPERLNESDHAEFLDDATTYDTRYKYLVQAVADDLHGSDVSAPVTITPEDKFPPAIPGALTAILGVSTVELAWTRNVEPDFKGYNVYRSTDGGPFLKIGEGIVAPTFSDSKIEVGKKYQYQVTAVDLKGNESHPSTPADASNQ